MVEPDFIYHQVTGEIYFGTQLLGKGHAGNGVGLNNPDKQTIHNIGPLPRGFYKVQPEMSNSQLGIVSMRLDPQPDDNGKMDWLFGRSGFYIHAPVFSEGCIVQDLSPRCSIAEFVRRGRTLLQVI